MIRCYASRKAARLEACRASHAGADATNLTAREDERRACHATPDSSRISFNAARMIDITIF